MTAQITSTSTTTTLKNNGNTYLSVDTNDDVAITNTLTATSPTFVTPNIGAATVTSLNGGQLDALYHAGVFPAAMTASIKAIKDKYPK